MKFYAGRPRDMEHLVHLKVTEDERQFVLSYVDWLEREGVTDKGRIDRIRYDVVNWKMTHGE